MSSLPPEAVSALVQLGVKLATAAVERHATDRRAQRRSLATMTEAEVLQAISEIEVRSADELIAEGQERAARQEPPA